MKAGDTIDNRSASQSRPGFEWRTTKTARRKAFAGSEEMVAIDCLVQGAGRGDGSLKGEKAWEKSQLITPKEGTSQGPSPIRSDLSSSQDG